MKKCFCIFVFLWCLVCGAFAGEGGSSPVFLLHAPVSLSSNVVERLRLFFDQSTDLSVGVVGFEEEVGYLEVADEVEVEPVFGHVVLLSGVFSAEGDVLLVGSSGVVGVQLGRLRVEDEDVFLRRVERYVLRAAGVLAGLADCPQPRCARCSGIDVLGVDVVGRNTCPPCRVMLLSRARERGVAPLDLLRYMPVELREKLMKARMKDGR